jgi:hypothetical protein
MVRLKVVLTVANLATVTRPLLHGICHCFPVVCLEVFLVSLLGVHLVSLVLQKSRSGPPKSPPSPKAECLEVRREVARCKRSDPTTPPLARVTTGWLRGVWPFLCPVFVAFQQGRGSLVRTTISAVTSELHRLHGNPKNIALVSSFVTAPKAEGQPLCWKEAGLLKCRSPDKES